MITAIDTNILLDVLVPGAPHAQSSRELLEGAFREGALVICEVVYAELASMFPSREDLERFLHDTGIRLEPSLPQALGRAAQAWRRYILHRGRAIRCPRCGHEQQVSCASCGEPLRWRQHIVSDFLVGGHAQVQADMLLTRDRGYYRTYFPDLKVCP